MKASVTTEVGGDFLAERMTLPFEQIPVKEDWYPTMKASVTTDMGHNQESQRTEYNRCKVCNRRMYRTLGAAEWTGTPTEDGCKCQYPNRKFVPWG